VGGGGIVICPACAAENRDGARFCGACGTPLSARCPACGTPHEPGQRFCDACGSPLAPGSSAAAPPPPAAPAPPAPAAAPVAELRVASVLFVDLVGHTSLAETRDAEDVRELLSRYYEAARTIVGRYGGVVEKFIGDAVVAVWGTPIAREDDAERAVRAGLELVDAVVVLGSEVGEGELRARAGVVTGQVASVVRAEEGLVVGDRVNTAARVQAAAPAGVLLVDEVTRQASSAAIAYEDAGEHRVKGKAEALRLWRAVRAIAGAGGSHAEAVLEPPFVGREAELRLVKDLFHATADRRAARLVAVSGPPGVGKSRLRRELANYLDGLADTFMWHLGRCLSYGDGVAYWALAEMVRQRLGIAEEAAPEEAARRLLLGLERWVPDPSEREYLQPRLGALLGTAQPGLGREELFAGWRLFFERLAELEPVILAFEDLHWADAALLDFIEHLLDWSGRHPIFVLTLARPELAERRPGWGTGRAGVTALSLEPLSDDALTELLDGFVDALPAETRDRIVTQAEGIPLFALETIRALADRGALEAREGRLVVVGELGELAIPPTLTALLAGRLDALAPEERALVTDLAVLGGSFPRAAVAAVSELPDERVDALLASLVRKQVLAVRADPLSPDRGQYAFAQTLLRTVAYERLSRHERRPRHLAAAAHLRAVFPNDGEELAEVIAAHELDAYRASIGDADADQLRGRAVEALRRAGRRAAAIGASDSAERAYRSALELARDEDERRELQHLTGQMALRAGRFEEALALLDEVVDAHAEAGRDRELAVATTDLASVLRALGRIEDAIARLDIALDRVDRDALDPDVARLNHDLGTAYLFAGRHEEALEPLERALRAAEALELPDVLSQAMVALGLRYIFTMRLETGRALTVGALAIAEQHGDKDTATRAHINLGHLLINYDRPGGEEHTRQALADAQRLGEHTGQAIAASNLMHAFLLAGRWDAIDELAAELVGSGMTGADSPYLHERLISLAALRGDLEGARAHLAKLAPWETSDDPRSRRSYNSAAGEVALLAGRPEEALQRCLAVLDPGTDAFDAADEDVRHSWPDAVEAALALGRVDEVARLLTLIEEQPRGRVPPFLRAHVARARGLLALAHGRGEEAEETLSAAIDAFAALDRPYWLARTRTDLAAWLLDDGRPGEASAHLDEAVPVLLGLGARPALERAQALQTAAGVPAG
jgi:class 3 adenylate cyclase/tetratricopeptide (TPR) repeat protein